MVEDGAIVGLGFCGFPIRFFIHTSSSTVPLAGVNSSLVKARADHGVVNFSRIGSITTGSAYNGN